MSSSTTRVRSRAGVLAVLLVAGALAVLLGVIGRPWSPAPGAPRATAAGSAMPLFETWTPPAGQPSQGTVTRLSGDERIPSSAGFVPRDASLYRPPAALVPDPPALPLVVFMMGEPGDPDPSFVADAMDHLAAAHHGLAPIVIVADQLGSEDGNPACVDSAAYGGVETYFTKDIPAWARSHLRVQPSPEAWTIAGFSNGGGCALDWGVADPGLWGGIVSIAGESYQGTEFPDEVLQQVFEGEQSAYDAAKPAARAAQNAGRFDGHVALFAAGDEDAFFTAQVQLSAQITEQAGFATQVFTIPGEDHVGSLPEGLLATFGALFPHLGLAPPGGG
ncbi:alpha/beta hydrolase [Microbacterium sp. NPDC089698]|jgi:Putative esterase|uniref:alpha/beta hydrolase n=1 Tax=Microbacterium sp. NPDC089698 TaxID=3364200 RepID=UPI00380C8463